MRRNGEDAGRCRSTTAGSYAPELLLSRLTAGPAIVFLEYDQRAWGYCLFEGGTLLDRFWSVATRPACEVTPHAERAGRTVADYYVRPVLDGFLRSLRPLPALRQEQILQVAAVELTDEQVGLTLLKEAIHARDRKRST